MTPSDGERGQELPNIRADLEANGFFWNIFDQAPDALFLYDATTERIVAMNRSAWESLGYERDELIGKTPGDFDPNVMQDPTFLLRTKERIIRGETFLFETRHRRKDGTEFPVEVRAALFEQADRRLVMAQARDITERKGAELEHRSHLWYLESIERVNRVLQASNDVEQMVNEVLDVVLEVFACDRTLLGTYAGEPEYTSLTVAARRDRPSCEGTIKVGVPVPIPEDFRPLLKDLKVAPGPLQHSLVSRPSLPHSLAEGWGLKAMLSMSLPPKLGEKDFFFTLGQCSVSRTWTADEVRLFREIGLRLGDAMAILSMLKTLRQSEARLEEAERIAHVGWWERDLLTNRVYLSDEVRGIFGLMQVDMQHWGQQHWFELIHPEDRPRALKAAASALRGAERYDTEYRLIRPDGMVRVVHSRGEVRLDDAGRPVRLFGSLQDVTELRHVEDELRASEARFRTFVDHATDGFFLYDAQLTLLDVNQHALNSLGYSREELIGKRPRDFDVGLDPAFVVQISERIGAGETVTFETLHRRKDGTQFPVEVRIRSLQVGERHLRLSLVRDITERRRAEQRLLAQHAVAQVLSSAQSMEDASPKILQGICENLDWDLGTLWRIDPDTDVLRFAKIWHAPSLAFPEFEAATVSCAVEKGAGLPGRVWADRSPACVPDVVVDPGFLRAAAAEREGLHAAFAFPILLGGEVLGVIDFLSREVRRPDVALLDIMSDIGSQIGQFIERKRAETALEVAEVELTHVSRVTTMGELTASIAHEVNQPIGAMVTSAAACKRWLAADPPQTEKAQRALERIVSDGKRAAEVIGRVRALLKRQAPRMDWLDMNETIREVVVLTRNQARRNDTAVHIRLAGGLAPVRGDRVQLQQVLINLIVNAIEAMSGIENRPRELTILTFGDPSGLSVEVRDTGPGVDPGGAQQLFEAFYTTKPEGIGMGLSISRSIVEAHGGRLSTRPNDPHGAVFLISLPLDDSLR